VQVETRSTAEIAEQDSTKRQYPRHFLSAPVTTWRLLNSRAQVTRGLILDISIGGLAAVLCGPPQTGERVSVRLNLLDTTFEAPAFRPLGSALPPHRAAPHSRDPGTLQRSL
jgi:hypothetical protein